MAHSKPVADTVEQMKTQTSSLTFGWDVVVNYSVEPINKLLAATYEEKPVTHIKNLKFMVENYDQEDKPYNVHYEFGLGAPLIKFQPRGDDPMCTLTIPVLDGTVKADGSRSKPTSVSRGVYSLKLSNLKLATAKGSWDPKPSASSDMFAFRDCTTDGHVVIDLQASNELAVSIEKSVNSSAISIPSIDHRLSAMSTSIKELLHKESKEDGLYKLVRYELARVKPSAPLGTYQLQPKFFVFDAFKESDTPSEDDAGILSLFIHTRANPPESNELFTSWRHQWRVALKCSPIPQGETASIIISKEMVYERVLEPAIRAKGFTVERCDEDSSIRMKIDTKNRIDIDASNKATLCYTRSMDAVHVAIPALTLKLIEHDSSGGSEISWKFDYSYGWMNSDNLSSLTSGVGEWESLASNSSGSVTVTHEIKEKFNKTVLDDQHLEVDCSVSSSDWTVSSSANDPGWTRIVGGTTITPLWASEKVTLPGFKIRLANINFFLTTNLLFPDDKQVIDIDKESGLHIPGDFYLVGTVKEQVHNPAELVSDDPILVTCSDSDVRHGHLI